jgi:hypothetical protein
LFNYSTNGGGTKHNGENEKKLTIFSCKCSSGGRGGGIYLDLSSLPSSLILSSLSFSSNFAFIGRGIYVEGGNLPSLVQNRSSFGGALNEEGENRGYEMKGRGESPFKEEEGSFPMFLSSTAGKMKVRLDDLEIEGNGGKERIKGGGIEFEVNNEGNLEIFFLPSLLVFVLQQKEKEEICICLQQKLLLSLFPLFPSLPILL